MGICISSNSQTTVCEPCFILRSLLSSRAAGGAVLQLLQSRCMCVCACAFVYLALMQPLSLLYRLYQSELSRQLCPHSIVYDKRQLSISCSTCFVRQLQSALIKTFKNRLNILNGEKNNHYCSRGDLSYPQTETETAEILPSIKSGCRIKKHFANHRK